MPAKTGIKVSPKPNKEAVKITTEGAVKHIRELLAANGSVQNPVYVRMLLEDYDARGLAIKTLEVDVQTSATQVADIMTELTRTKDDLARERQKTKDLPIVANTPRDPLDMN